MPFVQLEYAGLLGLADGRYLARAEDPGDPEQVLVVQTLGAPHPGRRSRRRRAEPIASPGEPETVPVTRVTVVRGQPFEDERNASRWLEETAGDREARVGEARSSLAVLNRALAALREATEDPFVHELGAAQALAIRIGYGTGEQLADGHWSEARQLPPPPTPKRAALDPQEYVAAVLSGRKREKEEEEE